MVNSLLFTISSKISHLKIKLFQDHSSALDLLKALRDLKMTLDVLQVIRTIDYLFTCMQTITNFF